MRAIKSEAADQLEAASYTEVLDLIRRWSPRLRTTLVHDVIDTLGDTAILNSRSTEDIELEERPHQRRNTLSRARGLLKADHPAPTDEQIEQWMAEHRMEKYG